jgi:hypothetical protein
MDTATDEDEPTELESSAVCPRCFAQITRLEDFCRKCGVPLTLMATSGPYEQVLARGYAYREGSNRPRKPIVVVGMWIIFGPPLAF